MVAATGGVSGGPSPGGSDVGDTSGPLITIPSVPESLPADAFALEGVPIANPPLGVPDCVPRLPFVLESDPAVGDPPGLTAT